MRRLLAPIVPAVLSILSGVPAASAQVSTTPRPLADPFPIARAYDDLKLLDDYYNAGNWKLALWHAKDLLQQAQGMATVEEVKRALDFREHYVIVTWIGRDAFEKPTLGRLVVHGRGVKAPPPSAEGTNREHPLSADLPGVGVGEREAVYEVFLSRGTRGKLADVYASTQEQNPTAEQLPAFAQAVASPLFDTIGVLAGPARPSPARAGKTAVREVSLAATVSRVGLPFEHATVTWKAVAKEPVGPKELDASLAELADDLKFSAVPNSACAQGLIDAATRDVSATVKTDKYCSADDSGSSSAAAACRSAIGSRLAAMLAGQRCGGATPTKDERADLETVDKKVRQFVDDGLTTRVEGTVTFENRPPTHWSFGVGSAVITSASMSLPRVKVDENSELIAADPLPRPMTLTFVNWSPLGYDAKADRMSWSERVRPFAGATLTPDFGFAFGANILLVRGVGVIGGGAVMFAKGANAEDIGAPPANPDQPFTISYVKTKFFFGLSYNFKL